MASCDDSTIAARSDACLLVLLALGDIDEGDDGAVDDVVQIAVGPDLHQIAGAILVQRHFPLDRDQGPQDLPNVVVSPSRLRRLTMSLIGLP